MKRQRWRLPILIVIAVVAGLWLWIARYSDWGVHLTVVRLSPASDFELRPVLATASGQGSAAFQEIIDRVHPYAAIDGTFYDERLRPLGDIVIVGNCQVHGVYNCAVAQTRDGSVEFIRRSRGKFDWRGCVSGVAAAPMLVHGGKVEIDPTRDGLKTMGLKACAPRSAIATDRNGDILLVVTEDYVTLPRFASKLVSIGAVEAMNLDGGPASALYSNGNVLVRPTLNMTNIIAVYKRRR